MFCPNCGKEAAGNFCANCGAGIQKPNSSNAGTPPPQTAAYQQPYTYQQPYNQQYYQRPYPNQQAYQQPNVVINNVNTNTAAAMGGVFPRAKNKWVALLLCFFFGIFGAHKFYEGKILFGIVYLFTCGLLGIGVFIDFFVILFKPNPYFI